jgi:hypothetical protein
VLRLDRDGHVTMVLGRRNRAGAEADLFDQPTDVAFGPNDEIFVTDGYGNSRVVKFDKDGNHLRTWGSAGSGPGQFRTPHTIVVNGLRGRAYVGDRDNLRTQVFDLDGNLVEHPLVGRPGRAAGADEARPPAHRHRELWRPDRDEGRARVHCRDEGRALPGLRQADGPGALGDDAPRRGLRHPGHLRGERQAVRRDRRRRGHRRSDQASVPAPRRHGPRP